MLVAVSRPRRSHISCTPRSGSCPCRDRLRLLSEADSASDNAPYWTQIADGDRALPARDLLATEQGQGGQERGGRVGGLPGCGPKQDRGSMVTSTAVARQAPPRIRRNTATSATAINRGPNSRTLHLYPAAAWSELHPFSRGTRRRLILRGQPDHDDLLCRAAGHPMCRHGGTPTPSPWTRGNSPGYGEWNQR